MQLAIMGILDRQYRKKILTFYRKTITYKPNYMVKIAFEQWAGQFNSRGCGLNKFFMGAKSTPVEGFKNATSDMPY